MRIVIDIDGTICETKKPGQTYHDVRVTPGAVEKIKQLKAAGHYIILQTARHMKTTGGDVKKVIEKVGKITEDWLKNQDIPYDEVHFGKPYNQIIIDDRCFWFEGWENFKTEDFDGDKINILIDASKHDTSKDRAILLAAVKSFEELISKAKTRLIFIVSKNDNLADENLKKLFGPDIRQLSANPSDSPIQTALLAKDYINNLQQLIICTQPAPFIAPIWETIRESNLYGMPLVFESKDEKLDYIKNDEWGYVQEAVEKKAVSNLASLGVNYFRCGRDFVSCAKAAMAKGSLSVACCYNELVKRGQQVKALSAELK